MMLDFFNVSDRTVKKLTMKEVAELHYKKILRVLDAVEKGEVVCLYTKEEPYVALKKGDNHYVVSTLDQIPAEIPRLSEEKFLTRLFELIPRVFIVGTFEDGLIRGKVDPSSK
ncbi:hypothetical protein [Ectobacillus panaciterrae]|uniref:hypothetical protein n=1 Tax=Ectobacillus panaciterrae TaxID=363872 RepID=UPI0003FEAE27|nr:hypothetical protein [Ectobacillus panaciterrae]